MKHVSEIRLKSGKPEEQHAYSNDFITMDNKTGYLGKVDKVELIGIHSHVVTVENGERFLVNGDILFEVTEGEVTWV